MEIPPKPGTTQNESLERELEALHWVRVALLQMGRFVESFLAFAESSDRDATVVTADGHFLLNACAQAEKALRLSGRDVPAGHRTTIRALRDVHEHWEQHKKSFESKRAEKSRSGMRFNDAHPEHLPWAFKFDATGTYISALRLEDLWDELIVLERRVSDEARRLAREIGFPIAMAPASQADFPRRESKCLAMAMVTQDIVLDFDSP